jgi:8-oxo-dGTP pyrophosphatase MutT (NUDIX family)
MNGFITYLYERLRKPLPGFEAQKRMMPVSASAQNHKPDSPANSIPCSVLLVLMPKQDDVHILLTLRSRKLSTHQGQISFPGGKLDSHETIEEGAYREAFEEVGLKKESLQLIGRMSSFYMSHTNMSIQPIVAELIQPEQQLKINPDEVEEAFWVSLNTLSETDAVHEELWALRDLEFSVPFWNVDKEVPLWGATAMMLSELLEIYLEWKHKY